MDALNINIKLVQEVEKYPFLYNPDYSGCTEKSEKKMAWKEIAETMNLTATECKGRWKNIRAMFLRYVEYAKKGAGENINFTIEPLGFRELYIKALGGTPFEGIPNQLEKKEGEQSDEFNLTATEEDSEPSLPFQQPPAPPLSYPSTSSPSPKPLHTSLSTDMFQSKESTSHSQSEPSPSSKTDKESSFKNSVDQAFHEYFETKRARMPNYLHHINPNTKTEGLKMFLLSMLPDLLKMSDEGVRLFKRKAMQTIDDILTHNSELTPSTLSKELFIPQDANVNNISELIKLESTSSQSTPRYEAERNIIQNYFLQNMPESFL